MNTLAKDLTLLGMRLVFGGLMLLNHGVSKFNRLVDYFNGEDVGFRSVLGLGEIPSLFLAVFSDVILNIMVLLPKCIKSFWLIKYPPGASIRHKKSKKIEFLF